MNIIIPKDKAGPSYSSLSLSSSATKRDFRPGSIIKDGIQIIWDVLFKMVLRYSEFPAQTYDWTNLLCVQNCIRLQKINEWFYVIKIK